MKLQSVELTNVFQHEHMVVNLKGNLIGVIGPNGSGKSNFLNAIHFAFGGDVPGKTKDRLLRWGADDGDVEVKFTQGEIPCEITRSVSKNSATFKYGTVDKRIGINKVAAGVQEHLGMDKDMLKMVFVKQAELDAILFEQASKRETAFQRMCGIGEATRVHKRLGELITTKFPPLPDFEEQIAVATAERGAQDQQLAVLTQAETELAELIGQFNKPRLLQDKTEAHSALEAVTASHTASQYMTHAKKAFEADNVTIEELRRQLGAVTLADVDREIQQAALRLDKAKTYQRLYTDWTRRQQAVKELGEPPCTEEECKELKSKADEINAESGQINGILGFYEKLLQTLRLADEHTTECPLCGSEVSDINVLKQRLNQEILACKQRQAKLDMVVTQQYAAMAPVLTKYKSESAMLTKMLAEAETMLKAAERVNEDVPKLENDIAGMKSVREELARLIQQIEQAETRAGFQHQQFEMHKEAHDRHFAVWGAVEELRGMSYEQAAEHLRKTIASVEDALTGLQQHEIRLGTIKGQINMLKQNMASLDSTIAGLKESREKQDAYNKVVETLKNVREWFHYSNGPHDLAVSVLTELTEDVNSFLEKLNAPFSVIAEDTGLAYKCLFNDGRATPADGPMDASELSGGQKVLLAVAFRLASYCMFANKQGILALDEPTAYLDDNNIGNFCALMGKLKEVAQALDLQILISTHERGLLPFFDTVVDFTPPEDKG